MTSVSPSLVEAAARAIRGVSRFGGAAELRGDLAERYAQAVVEAVGDALRLEGAEALWSNEPQVEGFPGPSRVRSDAPTMYGQGVTDGYRAGREQGRLEGAQAERERWDRAISTVRGKLHAAKAANPEVMIDEQEGMLDWVLDALGGVHPQASDG